MVKHIAENADFEFPKEFGFHGSAEHKAKGGPANTTPLSERGVPAAARQGMAPEHIPDAAEGHPLSGEHESGPEYAHGGHHMHPHGHDGARGHHPHPHGDGHVVHHSHGGYTHHHADGTTTHHAHGGAICHARGGSHHDFGEGTHLSKMAHGGDGDEAEDKAMVAKGIRQHENHEHGGEHTDLQLARGGVPSMHDRLPRGMKPFAARDHSPINTRPRPPSRNVSPHNDMPGGNMGYGVQPSAEPDIAGSDQSGIPQLKGGGHRKRHREV